MLPIVANLRWFQYTDGAHGGRKRPDPSERRKRRFMPTVEFLNAGKNVDCGQYANLRKVALLHDIPVYKGIDEKVNCQGNGLCGTCIVEIVEGADHLSPMTRREKLRLKGQAANRRLSCQCQVMGDITCITSPALD
jgi:ferredoxin